MPSESPPPPLSAHAPRPMAGYETPDEGPHARLTVNDRLRLVAAAARAAAGVLFCGMGLLYLPPQMWTPIMSGVGVVFVVNGSLQIWRLGRELPKLQLLCRILTWGFPAACVAVLLVGIFLGPVLGPDWDAMRARQEPATFQPAGVPR